MERKDEEMGAFIDQVQRQSSELQSIRTEREKAEQRRIERERKKAHETNLTRHLQKYFYDEFKKAQGETDEKIVEFYDLRKRNTIIFEISENIKDSTEYDATFLNTIYEKELARISKIFLNNDKYLENVGEGSVTIYGKEAEELIKRREEYFNSRNSELEDKIIHALAILTPIAIIGGIIWFFIWGYFHFAVPVLNG